MSTSLLYHAFCIRGYEYRSTDFVEGRMCFTIEQPRTRYRCPTCGSAAVHAQGHTERFLQTIPIGLKPTFVFLEVARVICFHCAYPASQRSVCRRAAPGCHAWHPLLGITFVRTYATSIHPRHVLEPFRFKLLPPLLGLPYSVCRSAVHRF